MDVLIGKNIRTRRKNLAISQRTLALKIGVAFQIIQKYENSVSKIPENRLYAIAEILKVTPEYFLTPISIHLF
jgi:transcriptional regulator with XRE-family HTH domain